MTDTTLLQAKLELETQRADRLESELRDLKAAKAAVLKYLSETQAEGTSPTAVAVRALLGG